ncbi:unnamed protein product, partial [Rangifer tarandus platyrhynchus]
FPAQPEWQPQGSSFRDPHSVKGATGPVLKRRGRLSSLQGAIVKVEQAIRKVAD